MARDVSRWAELLPHYVASTAQARAGDHVLARMIALRRFGPVAIPVVWRAVCWPDATDPADLRLHFHHVRGVTRGMRRDVAHPARGDGRRRSEGSDRRTSSAGRSPSSARTFCHGSLTGSLRGRSRRARWPGSSGSRSRGIQSGHRQRTTAHEERTAQGLDHGPRVDHAHRHRARRVLGGPALGLLARQAHRPLRPGAFRSQVAAQVDDFEPLDHLSAEGGPLDRSVQPVRAGGGAAGDGRLRAWSVGRSRRRSSRSRWRLRRLGARRHRLCGDPARALSRPRHPLVAPNLALAVFGGAAPANLGIALGLHGPILSTANSCAAGAVALGEAFHLIRGRRRRRGARGRRGDAAEAAGVRCVRHHPCARRGAQRRPGARGSALRRRT